eukprot:2461132-Ditylum_brightwellii.AAC.2
MSSPPRNINLAHYPSLLCRIILTQSYAWTYDFPNLSLHVVAHADSNQSPEVIRSCFEDHATLIISDFANEAIPTINIHTLVDSCSLSSVPDDHGLVAPAAVRPSLPSPIPINVIARTIFCVVDPS